MTPSGKIGHRTYLSKSRFVAGIQCHKYLWWKVHEPKAIELQPGIVLQDLFDQGNQVGQLARQEFPGGVLIDFSRDRVQEMIHATGEALFEGATAIFEASFKEDDTFVAVDVLERVGDAFDLIEVKSSSSAKPEHIPDAAVQKHVLTRAGIDVRRVLIMHLNKEFRHPDEGDLFAKTDVTDEVDRFLPQLPDEVAAQLEMLAGDIPSVKIGEHCFDPRKCPFYERCWPQTRDHIMNLYNVGPKKVGSYFAQGIHSIRDIPASQKLPSAARRQVKAIEEDRLIVEPTLAKAMEEFDCKLGYLDFETIARAVPVWPGTKPWEQSAAQFSYHEESFPSARPPVRPSVAPSESHYSHTEFLAEGPQDARPLLAEKMVEATRSAERVVTYSSFEKTKIRSLQQSVPHLEAELKELEGKLLDLLPVVRNNVYHPDFRGSFSIKYVLSPLVPDLTYNDLVVVDGMVASVEIARLLFVSGKIPAHHVEKTRADLLEYCKRDTWAMVRLVERLREL